MGIFNEFNEFRVYSYLCSFKRYSEFGETFLEKEKKKKKKKIREWKGPAQLNFFNLENHNFYKIPCNLLPLEKEQQKFLAYS